MLTLALQINWDIIAYNIPSWHQNQTSDSKTASQNFCFDITYAFCYLEKVVIVTPQKQRNLNDITTCQSARGGAACLSEIGAEIREGY